MNGGRDYTRFLNSINNNLVCKQFCYCDGQSYQLYDEAYQQHLAAPNTLTLAAYVELHNNYVQDVHAANAMADQFHNVILPQLIQVLSYKIIKAHQVYLSVFQLSGTRKRLRRFEQNYDQYHPARLRSHVGEGESIIL